MTALPDVFWLVRRRGADDLEDWIPVTDPAAVDAYRQSAHFEITECRQPHAHTVQRDVTDFHEAFDLTIGGVPAIRDAQLRADLILEEARETAEAITGRAVIISVTAMESERERSLVGAIDGLCDLLAVIYGAAVTFGVNLAPFWDEVHRTNMAKAGGPKRADGKQLKPEGWQPPDIAGLLAALYPGVCRGCGCTEDNACTHPDFGGCGWAEPGLCTACHPDAGPGWKHPDPDREGHTVDSGPREGDETPLGTPGGSAEEGLRRVGADQPHPASLTEEGEERRWLIQVCNECGELWDGVENHRHREGVRGLEVDVEVVPAERAEKAEAALADQGRYTVWRPICVACAETIGLGLPRDDGKCDRCGCTTDEVIDWLAEQRCIRELYGHWEDIPSRENKEARQRQRYAQLAKKRGAQESWKKRAREEVERFIEALRLLSDSKEKDKPGGDNAGAGAGEEG